MGNEKGVRKEMVMSLEDEHPYAVIERKIKDTNIATVEDFWQTAYGISAEHPDQKVELVAEQMLDINESIPDAVKSQAQEEKRELILYKWAQEDLSYITIDSPKEYRHILRHVSKNRGLEPAIVRGIIHNLHPGIETIAQEAEETNPDLPRTSKQPRAIEHNISAYLV